MTKQQKGPRCRDPRGREKGNRAIRDRRINERDVYCVGPLPRVHERHRNRSGGTGGGAYCWKILGQGQLQ